MVWKSTQDVGCGLAACRAEHAESAGRLVVVCLYSPPGNVASEFHNNVSPRWGR